GSEHRGYREIRLYTVSREPAAGVHRMERQPDDAQKPEAGRKTAAGNFPAEYLRPPLYRRDGLRPDRGRFQRAELERRNGGRRPSPDADRPGPAAGRPVEQIQVYYENRAVHGARNCSGRNADGVEPGSYPARRKRFPGRNGRGVGRISDAAGRGYGIEKPPVERGGKGRPCHVQPGSERAEGPGSLPRGVGIKNEG